MSKFYEVLQRVELPDESHLGLPVRSAVNLEATKPNSRDAFSNGTGAEHTAPPAENGPGTCMELPVSTLSPMLLRADQNMEATEQYRIILTKIVQHPTRCSLILVTSAGAGDGKSVTALNLAYTMAMRRNTPVLLLSGDLLRGLKEPALQSRRGLADVLAKQCSIEDALIVAREAPNLHLLPIGTARTDEPEWLDSSESQIFIPKLREHFKYIIIDAPPVGTVSDYYHLEALCEGIVVVVRLEHTARSAFSTAMKSIPRQKLLGVIVNNSRHWFWHQKESTGGATALETVSVREGRAEIKHPRSKHAI